MLLLIVCFIFFNQSRTKTGINRVLVRALSRAQERWRVFGSLRCLSLLLVCCDSPDWIILCQGRGWCEKRKISAPHPSPMFPLAVFFLRNWAHRTDYLSGNCLIVLCLRVKMVSQRGVEERSLKMALCKNVIQTFGLANLLLNSLAILCSIVVALSLISFLQDVCKLKVRSTRNCCK